MTTKRRVVMADVAKDSAVSLTGDLKWQHAIDRLKGFRDRVTNLLRPGADHDDVCTLLREAGEVRAEPEGPFFLPYLMGERSPRWSTDARVSRRSTISDAISLGCAITTVVGVGAVDGFDVARRESSRPATFLPGMESDGYALAAENFESAHCDLADWCARTGDLRRLVEAQRVGPRQACVKEKEAT